MARVRNDRLAGLLAEAGWSRAQAAAAFNRVARDSGLSDLAHIGRSHISMWVSGTRPSGHAPAVLCQALSRRLGRDLTPTDLGLADPATAGQEAPPWHLDPVTALADLGSTDLDPDRRKVLKGAVYSATSLALPNQDWWKRMATTPPAASAWPQRVGRSDVDTVQDLFRAFSKIDQRRGGGHGRTALVQYLHTEVAVLLRGAFSSDQVRSDMFSAAAELAYLSGWMAFDNSEHALAQRYFVLALKLSAHADNPPLTGHVLRAMAHQALDLGFARRGLELAEASVHSQRYLAATPRERALLGVVHARALASAQQSQAAARALLRAEDDLAAATDDVATEPFRTFFFSSASLAHETACTLNASGDHRGAVRQFRRSVRARGTAFRRTHAVTLGYLGAAYLSVGELDQACATWDTALQAMQDGVYSGRARQTVVTMRTLLSPYRRRGVSTIVDLDARAGVYLAHSG
jgi:tetratricopeptide (TPR) repeat protein